ncbi:MAG: hypothetical protein ABJB47_21785, partial [Actinomycetota bacterium]
QIVHTGRLPLFCFFVAFVTGFGAIRLSVRLIRAQVRWWPGNVHQGDLHVHHNVFGVVLMVAGGVAGLASPSQPVSWRGIAAAIFGLGTALVLDEFALMLHLRDVYWTSDGRVSVDAIFIAAGITALLLVGVTPIGAQDAAGYLRLPGTSDAAAEFAVTLTAFFLLAAVTLLKGKVWTALFAMFVPPLLLAGAIRIARPGSPWARWRYLSRPRKMAKATYREHRLRRPVISVKIRLQDLLAGHHDGPAASTARRAGMSDTYTPK